MKHTTNLFFRQNYHSLLPLIDSVQDLCHFSGVHHRPLWIVRELYIFTSKPIPRNIAFYISNSVSNNDSGLQQ
jgi:hypothetical protein